MEADVKPTRHTPAATTGAVKNPTIKSIRARRVAEEISGTLLARKANVDRSRLSFFENGHLQPSADEVRRLSAALDQLISAKHKVGDFASAIGWPGGAP